MRVTPAAKIVNPSVDNMTAGFTSPAVRLDHVFGYAVQVDWSGVGPSGSVKLQGSVSGTQFTDIDATIAAVSGNSGSLLFNMPHEFYNQVRVVYAPTAGSGKMTVWINLKGAQT